MLLLVKDRWWKCIGERRPAGVAQNGLSCFTRSERCYSVLKLSKPLYELSTDY